MIDDDGDDLDSSICACAVLECWFDCCRALHWALIGGVSDAISQAFDFVHKFALRFAVRARCQFHFDTLASFACVDAFGSFQTRFVASRYFHCQC